MKIKFLGAAQTVTGSKYLLTIDKHKVLVDCGLFQGQKKLRLRNWAALPIKPSEIDCVLITHAHIDHTGYLPLLVKNGFKGPIYSSHATYDLCSILLPDSGYLQEEDARRANKYGYSKHHPANPLYTKADAEYALKKFNIVEYNKEYNILESYNVSVKWLRAGHILGASFIKVKADNTSILFTGDMGRQEDPIMKPPAIIDHADYIVTESTYGNRLHGKADPKQVLAKIINETVNKGGSILIPAFAVGRSQTLLYYLYQLKHNQEIPDVPIYLDSPMAINATELLCKHHQEHKLNKLLCEDACSVAVYTTTKEESKAITQQLGSKIIISASGMLEGGRVLHHLKILGTDPNNTIVLSGFQAEGTRGADLHHGKHNIKIHGEIVNIKAKIENLTNSSAHADYEDILTWLKQFNKPPRKVFITHGEKAAANNLKSLIETELKWPCVIPKYLDEEVL